MHLNDGYYVGWFLLEESSVGVGYRVPPPEIKDIVDARFTLVEHLSGAITKKEIIRDTEQLNEFKQQTEEMRLLALKLMIDKFIEIMLLSIGGIICKLCACSCKELRISLNSAHKY